MTDLEKLLLSVCIGSALIAFFGLMMSILFRDSIWAEPGAGRIAGITFIKLVGL